MPNYCNNKITMKNIANLDLYSECNTEKNPYAPEKNFNFNKIIPMPETLNMTAGSVTGEAMFVYATEKLTRDFDSLDEDIQKAVNTENMYIKTRLDNFKNKSDEEMEKLYQMGKQYFENLEKYGHTTWYNWCWDNWGTKWNAWDTYIENDDTITFVTAWNPPDNVIKKLSEMFPDEEVTVEWDEEGGTAGKFTYLDGECIEEDSWEIEYDDEEYEEEEEEGETEENEEVKKK